MMKTSPNNEFAGLETGDPDLLWLSDPKETHLDRSDRETDRVMRRYQLDARTFCERFNPSSSL